MTLRTRLAALALLAASPLAAQDTTWKSITFGPRVGAIAPLGPLGDSYSIGWSVGAFVAYRPRFSQFGARLDGAYDRMLSRQPASAASDERAGTLHLVSGTLSGQLFLRERTSRRAPTVRPYLLVGAGAHRLRFENNCADCTDQAPSSTETKPTASAGLGAELKGRAAHASLEVRFVNAFDALGLRNLDTGVITRQSARWVHIDFALHLP